MDYKARIPMIKNEFKNHVSTRTVFIASNNEKEEIEQITWEQPGTNTMKITYLRKGSVLFVYGDCYEAIYKWYGDLNNLEAMSKCELSYFASKCVAGEKNEWDEDEAAQALKEYLRDSVEVDFDSCDCRETENDKIEEIWDAVKEDDFSCESEFELASWLRKYGEKYFGQDFWEFAYDAGKVISLRVQTHLIGLQMAIASINNAMVA